MTPRVFEGVEAHVPLGVVEAAWGTTAASEADCLISFGGGSAIDLAKAVVHRSRGAGSPLIHVAVPTTYAGAAAPGRFWTSEGQEPRSTPGFRVDLVVLDPSLTTSLPWKPTASTGMAALAHCWEAAASRDRAGLVGGPFRAITRSLPATVDSPQDPSARSEMLAASYAAGVLHDTQTTGLHDALCHALGSRAGVPYGVANSALLPHSVRAIGGHDIVTGDEVERIVRDLGLPRRLREAGVFEEDLGPVATWASAATDEPIDAAGALLRAAW